MSVDETQYKASGIAEPSTTDGRCIHCRLDLPRGETSSFCCSGCAVAHEAIQSAGLGNTYYSLRKVISGATGVPARTGKLPELVKKQIGSKQFIEESTADLGDGYRRARLAIDGMTCAACSWLVEQVVTSQKGIGSATVDLPGSTLSFDFDENKTSLGFLADHLSRFGYDLHPLQDRPEGPSQQERVLLTKAGVSWALAGNVMLLAFALYSGLSMEDDPTFAGAARWASFLIASASVAYGGSVFFKRAWQSLRQAVAISSLAHLHIDTPISLGILVGYFSSGWATISGHGEVWFDSITVLIAALLTSRWLQVRSQRKASQVASRLLDLIPSTARRLALDGSEEYIPSKQLAPGDTIRIDPGEVVPADGTVLSGRSFVNNAVITGESAPVTITPGDTIYAGAANQSSSLLVRTQSSGSHTRVGQLLDWLKDTTGAESSIETLVDRLAGYFVVGIIFASVITAVAGVFLFPGEVAFRLVALLVIACPCALGMATPLAIAVTSGKAAARGVYIKDGRTVEALAQVDTVVFDKTGTLTAGEVNVVAVHGQREALQLAAVLERRVSHPVASAITNYAAEIRALAGVESDKESHRSELAEISQSDVHDIEVVDGCGVEGYVGGKWLQVGKPSWIEDGAADPDLLFDRALQFAIDGFTPVLISIDGRVVTALGCGDPLRPGVIEDIQKLKRDGKDVYLLSGDHQDVVRATANRVGIEQENAIGGVGPERKRLFIERFQELSNVMMIGDGVNDAAALRTALVGVAIGNHNAPCLVASDIFISESSSVQVHDLITIGRRVIRLIRRNLGVSLTYNVVAGLAAIFGLVTPLVAAIAMPLSSLFVVGSSIAVDPFSQIRVEMNIPDSKTGKTEQRRGLL